jgi:glycerol uptake facilitator-like aquaporin
MFTLIATVGMPKLTVSNSLMVTVAEILGTAFFAFGIASVIYGKTPSQLSGVVVGGSLLLGICIAAALGSNGVLNPAVAVGIGSLSFVYVLAPIVGSVIGMQAYKYLSRV